MNVEIAPLLKLSREERLDIIEQLWESVEAESAEIPLSEAKLAEVLRRKELYEANPEAGYSLEQAIDYAMGDD